MSADLEFRLPIIKIISPENSDISDVDGENCVSTEEDCHTPKSAQHMIPPVINCPPAPRKPARRRGAAPSCKRKLCELEFFEVVAREEIESFFRRAEERINGGGASKRRCVL